MIKSFLFLLIPLFVFELHAQPFKYDEFGHVQDLKFKTFITKRGYKLVGNFYRISVGKKSIIVAKVLKGDKWTFIDVKGKEIESPGEMLRIEQNLPEIGHPDAIHGEESGPNDWKRDKLVGFGSNENRGMIYDGDTLAPAIYQQIAIHPADHLLIVKKDNLYGAINEHGNLVIPVEYESLSPIGRDATPDFFYYAKKEGKTGIISQDNRLTIPFEFEGLKYMRTYFETTVPIKGKPNNRGVIDLKGKEILPPVYTGINGDYNGYFIVSKGKSNSNKVVGMTDQSGKFILDTIYSDYHKYGNGDSDFLIQFEQSGTSNSSGIYDLRLKQFVLSPGKCSVSKIICQYGREAHCRTKTGYSHGWIGKSGKLLIEPVYEDLKATWDSPYLIVKKDGKYGVVDSLGKPIIPFKYEELEHFSSFSFETDIKRGDVFIVRELTKQGVINTKEKLLIPIEYESIKTTSGGIICRKEGLTKIMNLSGKIYLETSEFAISELELEYGFIRKRSVQYDLYGNKSDIGK